MYVIEQGRARLIASGRELLRPEGVDWTPRGLVVCSFESNEIYRLDEHGAKQGERRLRLQAPPTPRARRRGRRGRGVRGPFERERLKAPQKRFFIGQTGRASQRSSPSRMMTGDELRVASPVVVPELLAVAGRAFSGDGALAGLELLARRHEACAPMPGAPLDHLREARRERKRRQVGACPSSASRACSPPRSGSRVFPRRPFSRACSAPDAHLTPARRHATAAG